MKLRAFLTLFFVASAMLFAQVIQTGTIRGFVADPSAASVPKASVTVASDTKLVTRTTVAGADGGFLFLPLPRGTYEITVEAAGFSKYVRRGIQLDSGYGLRTEVPLKPGAVTTTVEVTADFAPPANTVNANVNRVISTQEIMSFLLPANGGDEYVSGGGWKFRPPADAVSEFRVTQIGNSPIDAVWGPGNWNIDGGVFRDFKIRERFTLQFRFEAYNALNHFNYNHPNTAFGQPTFGQITAKGGGYRNLQKGLRLTS